MVRHNANFMDCVSDLWRHSRLAGMGSVTPLFAHGFSALERCRLFVSENVEETQTRISEVMQPHRLRPNSDGLRHRAYMDFIRLRSVGVGIISFGKMVLNLEEVEDYHLMIFCRQGTARFVSGRRQMISTDRLGVCFAPGEPVRGEFSEDCEQVVFRIDATVLRQFSGTGRPRIRDQIDLGIEQLRPWANFVTSVFGDPAMVDLLATDRKVAADCESLFLSLWLSGGLVEDALCHRSIAPATVKRAEAFIDTNFADPITLNEIANAAGVPIRTLLESFRRFRGRSPMSHLKDRRMEFAREALLIADSTTSISEIAASAGFSHYSRFAAEYAKMFGERPNESRRIRSAKLRI